MAESLLGIGSYGKVCRATYGKLPCAAKLLHETLFNSGDPGAAKFAERFEQECQFLSNIRHPNIIQYLGIEKCPLSGRPILLMELMDISLTKYLEQSTSPLPYHTQVNICNDVALALFYLHSNNIIHRDLSGNNVLLIGDGIRAKVTDFGMSTIMEANPHFTSLTTCPGAVVYMPPEALTTPPHYSAKLDCFSFGILTIQTITRKFPKPTGATISIEEENGRVVRFVPERERRQNHIDLIHTDHPLLPLMLQCIRDSETERLSAEEICDMTVSLKSEQRYLDSVEESKNLPSAVQRLQLHLEQIERKFLDRDEEKGFPDKQKDREREFQEREEKLQAKEKELQDKQSKIRDREREFQSGFYECLMKINKSKLEHQVKLRSIANEFQAALQEAENSQECVHLTFTQAMKKLIDIPDYKLQKFMIHSSLQQQLFIGETWYLVGMDWMKQWKQYVGYDESDLSFVCKTLANPGPIDNSGLFEDITKNTLKKHLIEDLHYYLLSEPAWIKLVSWYGLTKYSYPIPRRVIENSLKKCEVELYLLELKLSRHPADQSASVQEQFSRGDTVGHLKDRLKEIFHISEPTECRVWKFYLSITSFGTHLSNYSQTLEEACVRDEEIIMIEVKKQDGTWPRKE